MQLDGRIYGSPPPSYGRDGALSPLSPMSPMSPVRSQSMFLPPTWAGLSPAPGRKSALRGPRPRSQTSPKRVRFSTQPDAMLPCPDCLEYRRELGEPFNPENPEFRLTPTGWTHDPPKRAPTPCMNARKLPKDPFMAAAIAAQMAAQSAPSPAFHPQPLAPVPPSPTQQHPQMTLVTRPQPDLPPVPRVPGQPRGSRVLPPPAPPPQRGGLLPVPRQPHAVLCPRSLCRLGMVEFCAYCVCLPIEIIPFAPLPTVVSHVIGSCPSFVSPHRSVHGGPMLPDPIPRVSCPPRPLRNAHRSGARPEPLA
jgi:hypothetical protein